MQSYSIIDNIRSVIVMRLMYLALRIAPKQEVKSVGQALMDHLANTKPDVLEEATGHRRVVLKRVHP